MPPSKLDTPIEFLRGVGPKRGELLQKELHISTFADLVTYYPFRHIDKSRFYQIAEITRMSPALQLRGTISRIQKIKQKRGYRLEATFSDDTGSIKLVWFKGINYIQDYIKEGKAYTIFGKPAWYNGFQIAHPEMEPVAITTQKKTGKLDPVYSTTEKLKRYNLDSRGILQLMRNLLEQLREDDVPEFLPRKLLNKYLLPDRYTAMADIHFPVDQGALINAQRRLKFEEFFLLQADLLKLKAYRAHKTSGFIFQKVGELLNNYYSDHLAFDLTNAQKRVLKEIRMDLSSGGQMNRLLQGDVGSGKTVVALMAMLIACDNGFQACLMAPTEILAQQHMQHLQEELKGLPIKLALLTGNIKGKEREGILRATRTGHVNMLIGTHALIEDWVKFENLGLAIIDEQHRFGVAQRAQLWEKNENPPHVLVMTATPIPRTLSMTVYGDLDVSTIDEMPAGRKPVKTIHRTDASRLRVFGFIKDEIAKGRQAYIVYPLIEESEALDYKNLMDGYEAVTRAFPFPDFKVGILHGRMKPEAKEQEMERFVSGHTHILVSTTVIEVGVNIPNASVMIIESAEKFGLAQLHQLRGRVGRGADQAYCILMTADELNPTARRRIKTMTATNDGVRIAEVDMELRGPGDMEGTQQSGIMNFKIANILEDQPVLKEARKAALALLEVDPDLQLPANQPLGDYLRNRRKEQPQWGKIA